jgi:hypothetical protein
MADLLTAKNAKSLIREPDSVLQDILTEIAKVAIILAREYNTLGRL